MPRIKNMGSATARFNEGIIISGSAANNEALIVTGSAILVGNLHISGSDQEGLRIAKGDNHYRQIVFENDGVDAASFTLSNAENLVIMNETAGKDIQFWVDSSAGSDIQAATIKENGNIFVGAVSSAGTDNNFFVSGAIGSRNTGTQGTSVFGGDLVVSGTLTAIQKHICTAKYTTDNSTQQYIRFNAAGSNGSPSVNNKFIAPCAGTLSHVMIRSTGIPGVTAIAFHRALNGTQDLNTTPLESVNITMSSSNTSYQVNFTEASNFGPGDIVGLSVNPDQNHGNVDITLVFELDFVL